MFSAPPDDLWFQVWVIEKEKPVLVKFCADGCGACRAIDPELQKLRQKYSGQLDVVEINIDEKRHLAEHYGIGSIPRLVFFSSGRMQKSRTGYASQQDLSSWVKTCLN